MLTRFALPLLLTLATTGLTHAADPGGAVMDYGAPYIESACDGSGVLGRIKSRFAYAEHSTWHRGYVIETIENPRLSNHPYAEPGIVKRDYCMAESVMTNGDIRTIYYVVEHGLGFAGIGTNVDFCVFGLDPWHVHDGSCRAVR